MAVGEMGDKAQLLAIVLAAAFRRPVPNIADILLATLVKQAAAGAWLSRALAPTSSAG